MKLYKLFVFGFFFFFFLFVSNQYVHAAVTVTVTADKSHVNPNELVHIEWHSTGADSCTPPVGYEWVGTGTSGSFDVGLKETTTFNFTCKDSACFKDAKSCPDGSVLGRVPPACDFAACPDVANGVSSAWGTYEYNQPGYENGVSSGMCVNNPVSQTKQFWVESNFSNYYTGEQRTMDQYVTIYPGNNCSDNQAMVNFSPMGDQYWMDNYWYQQGDACVIPFPGSEDISGWRCY